MSDFLDRYGDQLIAAELPPAREGRLRSRWSSPGRRRGAALAVGALLVVAVPAAAITTPWSPSLFRSGLDNPISTDGGAISAKAGDSLAVLRRPQTATDRNSTAPLVATLGSNHQVQGVQTSGIRAAGKGWAIVPATSVQGKPGVCLVSREGSTCASDDVVAETGVTTEVADASGTTITGVVPDGVAQVRFTPADGAAVTATVSGNFYELSVPQLAVATTVAPPPGYTGGEIPAPPTPVRGTLELLDASGAAVGQARHQ